MTKEKSDQIYDAFFLIRVLKAGFHSVIFFEAGQLHRMIYSLHTASN
ncbi:hypothetical protein [Glaciimonas sp. PCH181]|nr:hypothetical protein [Glaciimonas sp. PCH181]